MDNTFYTLTGPCAGELTEKKSRFIANIIPVRNETEAQEFIEQIRKKHRDARHNCWAYILSEGNIIRSSDDGEPSGSAGKPMADILSGKGLKDVCAVVTRYFGGTLLGVGGLVRAYSGAVEEALEYAETVMLTECERVEICCEYNDLGKVKNLLEKAGALELSVNYSEKTEICAALIRSRAEVFCRSVIEATAGRTSVTFKGTCFEAV